MDLAVLLYSGAEDVLFFTFKEKDQKKNTNAAAFDP